MYSLHPSQLLVELFTEKPYQGVCPDSAKFLFIGLDANYTENIESELIFPKIMEYHEDGEHFWVRHGVHHPFLLPEYSGDGYFYHKSFSRIGFRPQHADTVSFAEVLHLPTVGRSKLVVGDLDPSHLRKLSEWILDGKAEHIFMPSGVARLLRSTKLFPWLPPKPDSSAGTLKVLLTKQGKSVYQHLHFSTYGKFEEQKRREAEAIKGLLAETDGPLSDLQ